MLGRIPWSSRAGIENSPEWNRQMQRRFMESRPSQDAKAGGQASTAESADPVGSSLAAKTPDSELRNGPAITPARSRVQDFCGFISSGIAFASSFYTLSDLEYTCEQLEPAAESLPPPTAVDPRYLHHLAFPQCRPRSATEGRIEADFNGNAASQHRLIGSSRQPTLPQNRQGCEKSHSTKALVWYRRKANRLELPGTVRSTEYGVQAV
ncbi:hypothetical protein CFAM422_006911 [Trichoderma lentiforme]|uniref:Uncharacterized protein n=1 Tax=Trichoderma lentiforme TaxID=1567552 RepID=A0A9P4XED0_9HYPO|nr:hypothetical protein CFAM422_006911 [Trichoderma lentiforme]